MSWSPQPEPLGQLALFLKDSLNPRDKTAQKNAELALKNAGSNPDINNYLAYLCVSPEAPAALSSDDYFVSRSAAAVMLKNNVKISYKTMAEPNKEYLRSTILQGLQDQDKRIRSYAGNVVTEIVRQGGILGWPQVLAELISLIENRDGNIASHIQDGAMSALLKICEDNKKALNRLYEGQRPLDFLIPKLIEFTTSPTPPVRSKALGTLNFFVDDPMPQAMQDNVEKFLVQLFTLAQNDQDEEVRRFICRSFTKLASNVPALVMPHLGGIIDYVVVQQKSDPESDLALDAAEFFFENCEVEELQDEFNQHLDKIVPVLLESMIYSQDDQAKLEAEAEEDAEKEDKEEDIKPQFASAKEKGIAVKSEDFVNGNGYAYDDGELSDGELEDDDDYGEDPEEMWNLRKCSAAALDTFATRFHERVFEFTLPYLKSNLNHAEWPNREAAVLALGAISVGCMETVKPSLPDLVPFLISLLTDSQPVVRQITCWALGRYSSWASHLDEAGKRQFFEPMMEGILFRMLDNNKRVQEAAASAFANLEDQATTEITPYCVIIAQQFVRCFAKYKDKNMYILYDCVQTLAEHVGPDMAQPAIVDLLMPALIQRWTSVSDKSREMFPLLECLAYIATALGEAFAPYAKPFFSRCIKIIQDNLEEGNLAASQAYMDTPDKDFLVTSLDLLSAIIQALDEARASELIATANPNFFELLAYCMRDSNNDVKQSAFALLGDCAIYVFAQMQPYLDSIMRILTMQLDLTEALRGTDPMLKETAFRVINNACWSVGEIAMRHQNGMDPYVEDLLQKLGMILFNQQVPESLNQNAAIALGRMGLGNDQKIAPHLAQFAPAFLNVMQSVEWTDEKLDAFRGFVQIVLDNPQALEQCLLAFFSAIASVPADSRKLPVSLNERPFEGFHKALMAYKNMIPDFDGFISHLPQEQQYELRQNYSL
ncbi:ARM repeat-containing protein [Aureobasidium pullulans]|nr:ARM repeat-containing protein [Aureobasidium pullulans]